MVVARTAQVVYGDNDPWRKSMPTSFRPLPPVEVISRYYEYFPETGVFVYKTGHRKGRTAGHKRTRRGGKPWLVLVTVENVQYPAHRLVWKLITGDEPALSIDHINQDPFDNRWCNLRLADDYLQANNRTYSSDTPGVNFHKASGKWAARIQRNGKRVHLGLFDTKEAAIVCREQAVLAHATH